MAVHLITYGSEGYREAQKRLGRSALEHGVDVLLPRTREDVLRSDFYERNKAILDRVRYSGSALWKPWMLREALAALPAGDLLLYTDCTFEFTGDLAPLFAIASRIDGPMIFGDGRNITSGEHAKRDAFVVLGCDAPRFWNAPTTWSGIHIWKRDALCDRFLEEWLGHCVNPVALLDTPNVLGLPDLPGFYHHGLENSLLNIMAAKYGLQLYRCPHEMFNFAKMPAFRTPGEDLHGAPGYDCSRFTNSPYPSLMRHNNVSTKRRLTLDEAMAMGMRHHRYGLLFDLLEARQVYEQVLAIDPEHASALYLLALVELQLSGRHDTLVTFHEHGLAAAKDMAARVVARRPDRDAAKRLLALIETRLAAPGDPDRGLPDPETVDALLDLPEFREHAILVE